MLQLSPQSERKRINGNLSVPLILLTVFLIVSCQEPFEPTQENDSYYFSIYGYLDASADTQWVRITPVRNALNDFRDTIDATVTLESLETNESTVMNDSLFRYAGERTAWNFWTTMNLHPNQTYRLTATRSDGNFSRAEVRLPRDFPVPLFRAEAIGLNEIQVHVSERLADVQTIYYVRSFLTDNETVVTFSQLGDTLRTGLGRYQVSFNPIENEESLNHNFPNSDIIRRQVYVAITTNETPHFPSLDRFSFNIPDGVSNIQNGVGYLSGIVSKTIPYKSCFSDGGSNLIPCKEVPVPWQVR